MSEAVDRLESYLKERNLSSDFGFEPLTPDASTRTYFRIKWDGKIAIACVYPESFIPAEQSYLDVTKLFQAANLPVSEIYDFDGNHGIIIHEDFGDTILRDALEKSDLPAKASLLDQAIDLIARIQAATELAFELNSIASRLRFDEEKLNWELQFFKTHYFESLNGRPLSPAIDKNVSAEFTELSRELEKHAKYLCHRDYHAANLMLDSDNSLRMIDHQDARIGSAAYDLVSLLLDRVTETPHRDWLESKKAFFLEERQKLGLETLSPTDFDHEFDLVTVQRCLKAIGTFSNQTAIHGKTNYLKYVRPMFCIVAEACNRLGKFPVLQRIIGAELER